MTSGRQSSSTFGPRPGTPAKALLVTDKHALAEAMRLALNHGAYLTRVVSDLAQAEALIETWRPHITVCDMDVAQQALERLTGGGARGGHVPVIAVTSQGDLITKLKAFEDGVDDVLTLPFAPEELLARVLAVTRRTYGVAPLITPLLHVADLQIDITSRRVIASGHDLPLTSLELALLYLLAANAGEAMSKEEILTHLWGVDYVADSNVVERHIRNLRVKLNNSSRRPRYIFTVPGKGYRFARRSDPPSTGGQG